MPNDYLNRININTSEIYFLKSKYEEIKNKFGTDGEQQLSEENNPIVGKRMAIKQKLNNGEI